MDVETEIAELKRRVAELESEAKGERQLSRRQFEQIREIRDDMAVLRSHAVTLDKRLDRMDDRLGRLESAFAAFPGLIAETMREVLREDRKS
jgi:acyl carrier protein phosphodiesterase